MHASYAVPLRRASALPTASFTFHLAMDTLAVRLTVSPAWPVEDLQLQVHAPCRAHKQQNCAHPVCWMGTAFTATISHVIASSTPG